MDPKTAWNEMYGDRTTFIGPSFIYNELSSKYDNIVETLGYNSPVISAKTFMQKYKDEETNQLRILDIACGTGLVGEYLRKYNFQGDIDGVDGSQEMIDVSKSKNIYKKLWCKMITKDEPLIVEPNDCYDGIIISAAVGLYHVAVELMLDFMKILRPRGYFIVTYRTTGLPAKIGQSMQDLVDKLSDLNVAKLLSKEEFVYYENGYDTDGTSTPYLGDCFCFQKL